MFKKLFSALTTERLHSRIAFERTGDPIRGLPRGIYTINPDGSDCRQIRSSGQSPRWSPDGKWIAFIENTEDNGWLPSVFVTDADGQRVRRVTFHHDLSVTAPTWSPDSGRLAYSLWLWQERLHQICVVDVQTGQVRQITQTGDNAYPIWTPAQEIVFCRSIDPQNSYRLFVTTADGGRPRECPLFGPEDSDPAWTYDGHKVVFRHGGDFCVMNVDGSEQKIVPTRGRVSQMVLSPDGQSVAYSSCDNTGQSGFEVFVASLKGEGEIKLVANPLWRDKEVDSRDISWSPWL